MKKLTKRRLSLETTKIRELSSPHLQQIVGAATAGAGCTIPTYTALNCPTNNPTNCINATCHTSACNHDSADCYTTK